MRGIRIKTKNVKKLSRSENFDFLGDDYFREFIILGNLEINLPAELLINVRLNEKLNTEFSM